jgi:WD40 repeat protein
MEIKGVDLENIENQYISVGILRQYSDYINSIYFDEDKNIHMRGFHTYSWDLKNGDHYTEHIVDTRDQFLRDELENVKYDGAKFFIDVKRDILLVDKEGKLTDVTKVFWSKRRTKSVFTYDGKVFVYDVKSKSIINSYKELWTFKPEIAAVSEDGEFLLANEKEINAYDVKGKKIWTKKYDFGIYDLDISHNGWVAIGNYGKKLPVLFLKDGKEKLSI